MRLGNEGERERERKGIYIRGKRSRGEGKRKRRVDQSPKLEPTPGLSLAKIRLVRAGAAAPAEVTRIYWASSYSG